MSEVLLLRHGATAWNREKRMQGRCDVALADDTRLRYARLSLPSAFAAWPWISSPLRRARETALLLGAGQPLAVDERLTEMDWGEWEGQTLEQIRAHAGDAMAQNERLGIDFRPLAGESPREVAARLQGWFAERARTPAPVVAVTHKGVIRAALALATGWDMREDFGVRMDWSAAHLFEASRGCDGVRVAIVRLNIALSPRG